MRLEKIRQQLYPALIITRREVRDQFRDWRIIFPVIVLTIFFPGLMNFTAKQAVTFVERYGAPMIGDRLIPFLLMVVGFFPISVSLVIALESFVGEKERQSIEPLLCSPLNDWQLYLGKLLAAMVPPLMASYLGIMVYLVGVYFQVGWRPDPTLLIQIILLTTVQALVMVSGAVVVSSQTTSVRAANLLASFIVIPMALLIQGESVIMFWGDYRMLWLVVLAKPILGLMLGAPVALVQLDHASSTNVAAVNGHHVYFSNQSADVNTWEWIIPLVVAAPCIAVVGLVTQQAFLRWNQGQELRQALDRLMGIVYPELRRAARQSLTRRRPGESLESAALANEAYLKLLRAGGICCEDRVHFLALCSQIIRRIVVDHVRHRGFAKRGGNAPLTRLRFDAPMSAARAELCAENDSSDWRFA